MVRRVRHQQLPATGPERESLREKGQFWTPAWVAEPMVGYVMQGQTDELFDPAVGEGAFFRAAKAIAQEFERTIALMGAEIDLDALRQAEHSGLSPEDLAAVQMQSFVTHPPARHFKAIVANPPYIRHHRLSLLLKTELKEYSRRLIGTALDGRAGLHVYFLLRALELLNDDGRLAFIMPADTCEGKFASTLWQWITAHYRLEAVVTFAPEATPFPSVDTNAVVLMIRKAPPHQVFLWARCTTPDTPALRQWVLSGFHYQPTAGMTVEERQLDEALRTGLSRPPLDQQHDGPVLADFARVMRGIATGENDFFFLTTAQARELRIPDQFLRLAIGRTRDVLEDEITHDTIQRLDTAGRPTRLLSLDGRPEKEFPRSVQIYLRKGEAMLLPERPLISMRRPWYKMEVRPTPTFLFAYLGRRNTRFIRNSAGVLPLTGFLCVYPRCTDADFVEKLWRVLQHPDTIANLALVGKSYGAGAIKVEPRGLEQLPLPIHVLEEVGLQPEPKVVQAQLLERRSEYAGVAPGDNSSKAAR